MASDLPTRAIPTFVLTRDQHIELRDLVEWYDSRPPTIRYDDSFHEWFERRVHEYFNNFIGTAYQYMSIAVVHDRVHVTMGWETEVDGEWSLDPIVVKVYLV